MAAISEDDALCRFGEDNSAVVTVGDTCMHFHRTDLRRTKKDDRKLGKGTNL